MTNNNTTRFNRADVAYAMGAFRKSLRLGMVRVSRLPGIPFETALRREVAAQFGIKSTDFNTDYFAPATLKRLADFFEFPHHFDKTTGTYETPTQDEIAWAVQNFINRRKQPWDKFVARVLPKMVLKPLDEVNDPLEILDGDTMVLSSEARDN